MAEGKGIACMYPMDIIKAIMRNSKISEDRLTKYVGVALYGNGCETGEYMTVRNFCKALNALSAHIYVVVDCNGTKSVVELRGVSPVKPNAGKGKKGGTWGRTRKITNARNADAVFIDDD